MSVLDLSKRITDKWGEYNDNLASSDSLVFISHDSHTEPDGPSSINITVGKAWYDVNRHQEYTVGAEGCKLQPQKSILIEASQEIAIPLNVFGIIVGTGKNIYRGGFISSGKINPGFKGRLKVGIYNGSSNTWIFKPGDLLGSCVFFDIETHMDNPLQTYIQSPEPTLEETSSRVKLKNWIKSNKAVIVTMLVCVINSVIILLKHN